MANHSLEIEEGMRPNKTTAKKTGPLAIYSLYAIVVEGGGGGGQMRITGEPPARLAWLDAS
jgi:hypothetical protein